LVLVAVIGDWLAVIGRRRGTLVAAPRCQPITAAL